MDGKPFKKSLTNIIQDRIDSTETIAINLFFNIMNGGAISNVTEQRCIDAMADLNSHFSSSNIVFRFNGYSNRYNQKLSVVSNIGDFRELSNITTDTLNIQIFLIDSYGGGSGGRAQLPGTYLCLTKDYLNEFIFAHMLGHNLNLFHTFHGQPQCEPDVSIPMELHEFTNCAIAGDLICDTPIDPCMDWNTVNENCEFLGLAEYKPDTRNIMSYTALSCGDRFTPGQSERMREALLLIDVLQSVQTPSSQLARPIKISSTDLNYQRKPIGDGCFEISYFETDRLEFQKGFDYNIVVIRWPFNNEITYTFTSNQTPVINESTNSYRYVATATSLNNVSYSASGSAGFVTYIDCPIYFPYD